MTDTIHAIWTYAYTSSSSINSGIAWWMESFGNPRVRLQLEVSPDTTPDYMMWDCGNFFLLQKLLNVWHNQWNFGLRWRAPCQRITRQGRWHLLADYYEVLGSRYAGTGVLHDDTISLLAIDVSLRCAKCFLCSSLGPGGGTACNPFESMRLPRAPEPRIHYATSGAAQSERARAVWERKPVRITPR